LWFPVSFGWLLLLSAVSRIRFLAFSTSSSTAALAAAAEELVAGTETGTAAAVKEDTEAKIASADLEAALSLAAFTIAAATAAAASAVETDPEDADGMPSSPTDLDLLLEFEVTVSTESFNLFLFCCSAGSACTSEAHFAATSEAPFAALRFVAPSPASVAPIKTTSDSALL
jgi:hypothetical protein